MLFYYLCLCIYFDPVSTEIVNFTPNPLCEPQGGVVAKQPNQENNKYQIFLI